MSKRTTTDDLIDSLATNLAPVRRLAPPLWRCARWLVLAAILVTLLGVFHGARPDLIERLHQPLFALRLASIAATAALAAAAALLISQPDRSPLWGLLPAPAMVVWLATLAYGCAAGWTGIGPEGVPLSRIISCLATLTLTGAPLAAVMFVMVRRSRPLRPLPAALSGALAAGAISVTALSLFHAIDESVLVLIANIGVAAFFIALGAIFAKTLIGDTASA